MTKKLLLGLISIFLLTHCSDTKTNNVTKCGDFNIVINYRDTVGQEDEVFASIHISNPKYTLIHASILCNVSDTSTVDTLKGRIYRCNQNLTVENDSVKLWWMTGKGEGKLSFQEITLLAKGVDNKYYYQKCGFDYYVK